MSTTTAEAIAFRCNKCWQLTSANTDQAGQSVECVSCSTPLMVPEPTPELIAAGAEFLQEFDPAAHERIDFNESLTKSEIERIARDKVHAEARQDGDIAYLTASRMKRFSGAMIDGIVGIVVTVTGFVLCHVMGLPLAENPEQVNPKALVVLLTLPAVLGICQMFMVASWGQTIGKFCVASKIVNAKGNPPGFFQGVFLRMFVVGLMGAIPFFSLLDVLWIFGEDRRCLHDLIAGTYVIDA